MRDPNAGEIKESERIESREWLDSLDYVLQAEGPDRARRLLRNLQIRAEEYGVQLPYSANTPYINTISAGQASTLTWATDFASDVTIDGIGFAAIGRLKLLQLLQARVRSVGVEPQFGRTVTSLDARSGNRTA